MTENKGKIMPADMYALYVSAGSIVALFLIFCISLLKSLTLNVSSGWIWTDGQNREAKIYPKKIDF